MTTFINIFGGPGSGKSTNAARLFSKMKQERLDVEMVTEVAKDFVWEEREKTLNIQPYISIKQFRNLFRLKGKVDFVITDAPLLLGILYARTYASDLPESYEHFIVDLHDEMLSSSINIMLTRRYAYDTNGRYQTEEEAKRLDEDLIGILDEYNVDFSSVAGDDLFYYIKNKCLDKSSESI